MKIVIILLSFFFGNAAFAQQQKIEPGDTLVTIKKVYHLSDGSDSTVEKQYIKKREPSILSAPVPVYVIKPDVNYYTPQSRLRDPRPRRRY